MVEGGGSSPDTKTVAIDNIEAYANDSSRTAPTLEDYSNAGVQGVTADNLGELNALVDALEAEDVDTTEEIKALLASLDLNILPVANTQTVTLNEDSSKAITLTASDANGDELTYSVTQPTHGILSGTAPQPNLQPNSQLLRK